LWLLLFAFRYLWLVFSLATGLNSSFFALPHRLFVSWKFWPIVHCVTYSVIPSQHRVLWVNSVDLVWNAILSSAAQKEDAIAVEDAAATPAEERPGTVVGAATAGETNGCGSLQAFDESSESIHATNMTLGGGGAANTTATGALLVGA
jgi:hypothetical protein